MLREFSYGTGKLDAGRSTADDDEAHPYLYHALGSFRSLFSHHRTWLKFALVVLGFIASTEMVGVSSWCRFWLLDVNGYHSLLQFFRSSAWSLSELIHHWAVFVLAQQQVVYTHGRCVLLGDHTYVSKEGRRMPGVVTLHQELETQSKPCYFRGQCWGVLGIVVGSLAAPFCLPLGLRLHQGWQHLGYMDEPSTRCRPWLGLVIFSSSCQCHR